MTEQNEEKQTNDEQNEEQIMKNILKDFTYRNKDFFLLTPESR